MALMVSMSAVPSSNNSNDLQVSRNIFFSLLTLFGSDPDASNMGKNTLSFFETQEREYITDKRITKYQSPMD
jgi:hypothetical protein